MKYYFMKFLVFSIIFSCCGCAIVDRIMVYESYNDKDYNKENAALLFAGTSFSVKSIDGDNKYYYPVITPGAYGGSHIYLKPGEHEIRFGFGKELGDRRIYMKEPVTLRHNFEAGNYYEFYANFDVSAVISGKKNTNVRFIIKNKGKIPENLPKTGWEKIHSNKKS